MLSVRMLQKRNTLKQSWTKSQANRGISPGPCTWRGPRTTAAVYLFACVHTRFLHWSSSLLFPWPLLFPISLQLGRKIPKGRWSYASMQTQPSWSKNMGAIWNMQSRLGWRQGSMYKQCENFHHFLSRPSQVPNIVLSMCLLSFLLLAPLTLWGSKQGGNTSDG